MTTVSISSRPAKRKTPRYELREVTPKLAAQWLLKNERNRNLRQRTVDAYARDMIAGRWAENGEAIKFGVSGTLLDGQTRLSAIVKSGVTIQLLVAFDLDDDSQKTMDSGNRRSASDELRMRGDSYHVSTVAVARKLFIWDAGDHNLNNNVVPTNAELLSFIDSNPEIANAGEFSSHYARLIPATSSVIGLCYIIFSRISYAHCEEFFSKLASGADLSKGNPILTLRTRLSDVRNPGLHINQTRQVSLFIRAWNAWRQGRTLASIPVNTSGPFVMPEPR